MISKEDYDILSLEDKLKYLGITEQEVYFEIVLKEFDYDRRYYYKTKPIHNLVIVPREIRGTQHAKYHDRMLIDNFITLKKGYKNVNYYLKNPDHYINTPRPSPHEITMYKVEGKGLFINQGNNRLIIAMILGLPEVVIDYCEVYEIDYKLKLAIENLEENGFEIVYNEKSRTNFSALPLIIKYKDTSLEVEKSRDTLEAIYDIYKSLRYSKYKIIKHKILSFISRNYLNKYKNTDKIKDWFHQNYLKFEK